ncbi:hypothetical protein [Pedobacter sp. L105]|uniref:hypothetical protein n=1 Tax=Pedobacter sp. L105 TaxID=1641871 RepID=UPI00131DAB41|nr:hypothetical protein [Pedobacter sp. L105]
MKNLINSPFLSYYLPDLKDHGSDKHLAARYILKLNNIKIDYWNVACSQPDPGRQFGHQLAFTLAFGYSIFPAHLSKPPS